MAPRYSFCDVPGVYEVTRRLRFVIGIVGFAALVATVVVVIAVPLRPEIGGVPGLIFWTAVVALSATNPVKMAGGTAVDVTIAPVLAAAVLGGPTAAAVVAVVGTFEIREIRGLVGTPGGIPWYGTLYNHAAIALPAITAAFVAQLLVVERFTPTLVSLVGVVIVRLACSNSTICSRHSQSASERNGLSSRCSSPIFVSSA